MHVMSRLLAATDPYYSLWKEEDDEPQPQQEQGQQGVQASAASSQNERGEQDQVVRTEQNQNALFHWEMIDALEPTLPRMPMVLLGHEEQPEQLQLVPYEPLWRPAQWQLGPEYLVSPIDIQLIESYLKQLLHDMRDPGHGPPTFHMTSRALHMEIIAQVNRHERLLYRVHYGTANPSLPVRAVDDRAKCCSFCYGTYNTAFLRAQARHPDWQIEPLSKNAYGPWSTHSCYHRHGNVRYATCPVLRDFKCPICGATGDYAHTHTKCPYQGAVHHLGF